MSRTVGFVEAAAALAVAAASGVEAPDTAYLDETVDNAASPPSEITEDPVTEESTAEPIPADVSEEPEKPKRGRKKAEVSDESDSDG